MSEEPLIETTYPITFRKEDSSILGQHLKNRHSVVLIGMKRVGISNFLRFFLYHNDIKKTFIADGKKHLFIPIDLNDLVERELFPFWALLLKRIVDTVNESAAPEKVKKDVEALFLDSIQSQDLFLRIENVRRSLVKLVDNNLYPTLFLLRFDRIKDVVTPEFFSNLQGLKDATHNKLCYVFTSFRGLDSLSPSVFQKASLSVFANNMYMQPAKKEDAKIIYNTYKSRYTLFLSNEAEQSFLEIVDGYVQYLQLALIFLHEQKQKIVSKTGLFDTLIKDERISLQSEELWESLSVEEQRTLSKVSKGKDVAKEDKEAARYLWDTGLLVEKNKKSQLFSLLFDYYVKKKDEKLTSNNSAEFTKKEHLLFHFLQGHVGEICEREQIIEAVWPEVEALGISDWAIDRLVARVRSKLRNQKSGMEIQTVRTRGYKLVNVRAS